ncbi:MAG TPA: gamma-glutamyltransferase [Candidatus Sulfotelmatobacter sp.]|nr:gamma-glutamyltransferase [Candidatus Sulfotelmatobacter sp.]
MNAKYRDFHSPGRSVVLAENGMAATSQPQATRVALDVLRGGGNAFDAAVAAAAMLAVIEPAMTSIGGDCFVLFARKGGKPEGLNGSGRAPAAATLDWYLERRLARIEPESPHAVTVPGAIDAWCRLIADHGTRDIGALLEPAAAAAADGFLVTPRIAWDWETSTGRVGHDAPTKAIFLPGGRAPALGERHRNPKLAETLRTIGRRGRDGFYAGPVMEDLVAHLTELGGLHTADDFAAQRSDYVTPITAPYRGYEVAEIPPNGQGITALIILKILSHFEMSEAACDLVDRIHLFAEATKAAYWVRDNEIGDPATMRMTPDAILDDARIRAAVARIDRARARPQAAYAWEEHKDTTYLTVVDRDRNAVSFINSLFQSFGSGITGPKSGVLLHNRGISFRIAPRHPNAVGPRKRPMHTIIPAMLLKDGKAQMPFGVMGGHYQGTGHASFVSNLLDLGLDPQQANDAPRHFASDGFLQLEGGVPAAVAEALAARGHQIERPLKPLGGCQAIWIDHERGLLMGASDPRKDGCAFGY